MNSNQNPKLCLRCNEQEAISKDYFEGFSEEYNTEVKIQEYECKNGHRFEWVDFL